MHGLRNMAALFLVLAVSACETAAPSAPPLAPVSVAPASPPRLYRQEGHASWYGVNHHGRKTASGVPFDKEALTAAHRTLPLSTRLRVTNLENGRSVEVVVNDRGPYVPGRLIDVSEAAARSLGFAEDGVARVRVEEVQQAVAGESVSREPVPVD